MMQGDKWEMKKPKAIKWMLNSTIMLDPRNAQGGKELTSSEGLYRLT